MLKTLLATTYRSVWIFPGQKVKRGFPPFPPDFLSKGKALSLLAHHPPLFSSPFLVSAHSTSEKLCDQSASNSLTPLCCYQIRVCLHSLFWDSKCFVTCAQIIIPALSFIIPLYPVFQLKTKLVFSKYILLLLYLLRFLFPFWYKPAQLRCYLP